MDICNVNFQSNDFRTTTPTSSEVCDTSSWDWNSGYRQSTERLAFEFLERGGHDPREEQYWKAIQVLERALNVSDPDLEVEFVLAHAYIFTGEVQKSARWLPSPLRLLSLQPVHRHEL